MEFICPTSKMKLFFTEDVQIVIKVHYVIFLLLCSVNDIYFVITLACHFIRKINYYVTFYVIV